MRSGRTSTGEVEKKGVVVVMEVEAEVEVEEDEDEGLSGCMNGRETETNQMNERMDGRADGGRRISQGQQAQ
jgi:hypothetical protein